MHRNSSSCELHPLDVSCLPQLEAWEHMGSGCSNLQCMLSVAFVVPLRLREAQRCALLVSRPIYLLFLRDI